MRFFSFVKSLLAGAGIIPNLGAEPDGNPAIAPPPVPAGQVAASQIPWNLEPLGNWHRQEPDSIEWRVSPIAGVMTTRKGWESLRNPSPATARRCVEWFSPEIEAAARDYLVPVELIIACLCAESVGGAKTREDARLAERREPGFIGYDTTPTRVSIGAMQTLLSTARRALGQMTLTAADLRSPGLSIRAGTAYIASQAALTGYDPVLVGAAYNAGGLYRDKAPANPWRLRCYPLGTGEHVTRFCRLFGDALLVVAERPGWDVPSVYRSLKRL